MAHRSDDRHTVVGGGGQVNDGFLAWLKSKGTLTGTFNLNDAQRSYMKSQTEPVAVLNDQWWSWMGKAPRSLTGALPDRFKAYWRSQVPP